MQWVPMLSGGKRVLLVILLMSLDHLHKIIAASSLHIAECLPLLLMAYEWDRHQHPIGANLERGVPDASCLPGAHQAKPLQEGLCLLVSPS